MDGRKEGRVDVNGWKEGCEWMEGRVDVNGWKEGWM